MIGQSATADGRKKRTMKTKQHDNCPLDPGVTDEEFDAMDWLMRVLDKMASKPDHRNHENAVRAMSGFSKLADNCAHLHDYAHALEEERSTEFLEDPEAMLKVREMIAVARMTTQEVGEA
jgi:hypothetical protein